MEEVFFLKSQIQKKSCYSLIRWSHYLCFSCRIQSKTHCLTKLQKTCRNEGAGNSGNPQSFSPHSPGDFAPLQCRLLSSMHLKTIFLFRFTGDYNEEHTCAKITASYWIQPQILEAFTIRKCILEISVSFLLLSIVSSYARQLSELANFLFWICLYLKVKCLQLGVTPVSSRFFFFSFLENFAAFLHRNESPLNWNWCF